MFVGTGATLVAEALDEVVVVLRCELRVTVPLMMLSVTRPPPPTRRVRVLVDPREAEVVVRDWDEVTALPVPVFEAVPLPLREPDEDVDA